MVAMSNSDEDLYFFIRGNPVAFNILGLVSESARGLTVTEIATKLNKMPPSISRAVSKLVDKGLLESVRVGRNKFYKIKAGKNETVNRLVENSIRVFPRPPMFRMLSLESSAISVILKELEQGVLRQKIRITAGSSLSGKHLDHGFDIVLHNSKTVAIEIAHSSDVNALFERIGRWADLRGSDVSLIILVILGGLKQPYRSFFETLGTDHKPPIQVIVVDIPLSELNERSVREKVAKPIAETISILTKRR
jgi:DNA-binding transcriptional ArsR family regulator